MTYSMSWFSWWQEPADPIVEVLRREVKLMQKIKYILSCKTECPDNDVIFDAVEQLNAIFRELNLQYIPKPQAPLPILGSFFIQVCRLFVSADQDKRKLLISCMNGIIAVMDIGHPIPNLADLIGAMGQTYHECFSLRMSMTLLLEGLMRSKMNQMAMMTPEFFGDIINKLFSKSELSDSCEWLVLMFTQKTEPQKIHFNATLIPQKFLEAIKEERIAGTNANSISRYFCEIMTILNESDLSSLLYFMKHDGLTEFLGFLAKNGTSVIEECYVKLAKVQTGTVQQDILSFILSQIVNPIEANVSEFFLSSMLQLLCTTDLDLSLFERVFPIYKVFKLTNRSDKMVHTYIGIFEALVARQYEHILECLSPILEKSADIDLDNATTEQLFSTIQKLLKSGELNSEHFTDTNFVDVCIYRQNPKRLAHRLLTSQSFLKTFVDSYRMISNVDGKWGIFVKLISMEEEFSSVDKFKNMCSMLLSAFPSIEITRKLMNLINLNPTRTILTIFMNSFCEKNDSAKNFVAAGGLQWLDNVIEKTDMANTFLPAIISSLCQGKVFDDVNNWVTSLDTSHLIFNLPDDVKWSLAFGSNCGSPFQLRIPALLPVVNDPHVVLSPYNAYYGSKMGLGEFLRHGIDIDSDNSLIPQFTNMYITPEQYAYIAEHAKQLVRHVDLTYDHFSVFEFAQNSRESAMTVNCEAKKAICFWVRADGTNQNDFNITVVTSRGISMDLSSGSCRVIVNGESKFALMNGRKWNMFAFSLENNESGSVLHVYVNNHHMVFQYDSETLSDMTFGTFKIGCQRRWFIGGVMRLWPDYQQSFEKCFKDGPGSTEMYGAAKPVRVEAKESTAYYVPYAGFLSYVKKANNLRFWFLKLMRVEERSTFEEIMRMLLNCWVIRKGKIRGFAEYLMETLKVKRDLITNDFFSNDILEAALQHGMKQTLLGDLDLWELYREHILKLAKSDGTVNSPKLMSYLLWTHRHDENERGLFLDLIMHHTKTPDNLEHLFYMLFNRENSVNVAIIKALIDNLASIKTYINSAVTGKMLIDLLIILPIDTALQLLDLVCLITVESPMFESNTKELDWAMVRFLKYPRVWYQLFSMLTGTTIFEGESLYNTFAKMKIKTVSVLPTIASLITAGLFITFCMQNTVYRDAVRDAMNLLILYMKNAQNNVDLSRIAFQWPFIFHADIVRDIGCRPELKVSLDSTERGLFSLWNVPDVYASPLDNLVFPASMSPVFNALIPAMQDHVEDMSFDFDVTLLDLFNGPDLRILTGFVSMILFSMVDKPVLFGQALNAMIFHKSLQFDERLGSFAMEIMITLLGKPHKVLANKESMIILFEFLADSISHRLFGTNLEMFYGMLFPIINAIHKLCKFIRSLAKPLRSILLSMFDYLTEKQISDVLTTMLSMNKFVYSESGIFSKEFIAVFSERLSPEQKQTFDSARKGFRDNGPLPDDSVPAFEISDLQQMIVIYSEEMKSKEQALQLNMRRISADIDMFCQHYLNMFLRRHEQDRAQLVRELWKAHMNSGGDAQSYVLSLYAWPCYPPRVLAPSPFKLELAANERVKQEIFPASVLASGYSTMKLYPDGFTDISMESIDATQYSITCPISDSLRLHEFSLAFKNAGVFDVFANGFFLRYNEKRKCAIFASKTHIVCLIHAYLDGKTLHLETDPGSAIIYKSLIELFQLDMFGSFSLFCGHPVLVIPYTSILCARSHQWLHKPCSIRIFSMNSAEFILIPADQSFPSELYKRVDLDGINRAVDGMSSDLTPRKAVELWRSGILSTWDFMLALNSLSGRSFADLSQYPVFPWIDGYTEDGKLVKRDLSKPMGQQTPERTELYERGYQTNYMYYYGSHYSMAASVHHFMVRLAPFTQQELDLHQGFDNVFRMFTSVSSSWTSASERNINDTKELVAEWFSVPEIFMNVNGLSSDQLDAEHFHVNLPKKFKNATNFVLHSRANLEHEQNINRWIDLIFGAIQTGPAAIAAKNLFLPISYQTAVTDNSDPITVELQLEHWGQCPIQLFKKPLASKEEFPAPLFDDLVCKETDLPSCHLAAFLPNRTRLYVEKESQSLVIQSIDDSKITETFVDRKLAFAMSLSNSAKGSFAAVDLENGSTLVYQILNEVKRICTYSHSSRMKTRINGLDCICASIHANTVTLWDFRRAAFVKKLTFEDTVIDCGFDESYGLLFVVTKTILKILNVNGFAVHEMNLENAATSLYVPNAPAGETNRPVFIGFDDGILALVKFSCESSQTSLTAISVADSAITYIASYTRQSIVCGNCDGRTVVVCNKVPVNI